MIYSPPYRQEGHAVINTSFVYWQRLWMDFIQIHAVI